MADPSPPPTERDGVVRPERVDVPDPDQTPDQQAIEIDSALERPKEGDPGERGVKHPD